MYGTAKESSGSTPSESSGSVPEESSGSSGYFDSSSSGGSSGSSGSDGCSFYISTVLYGGTDDTMEIFLFNDGSVMLEITDITGVATFTCDPPLPVFLLPSTGDSITVTAPSTDLRGTTFTVVTSCGDATDVFPVP
jgi:hypothetical protein